MSHPVTPASLFGHMLVAKGLPCVLHYDLLTYPPLVLNRTAGFHTAAVLRSGLASKKRNIKHTEERLVAQEANRPSVILGTRPQEEAKLWPECALAKCLVNAQVLNGWSKAGEETKEGEMETQKWGLHGEIDVPDIGTVTIPKATNYGVGSVEKQLFINELPAHNVRLPFEARGSPFTSVFDSQLPELSPTELDNRWKDAQKKEAAKLEAFAKVIDLRNANAKGIAYENRRRIILEFSDPKNPYDPGRAEVQGQFLYFTSHLFVTLSLPSSCPFDIQNP